MNVNLPHIVTISDLFCNYDVRKLKGDGNIKRKYKCEDKKALAKKIFLRYLYILMCDMVEGGKTYIFPFKRHIELRFRILPDAQFKTALRKGAYEDLDALASNFKCYEMIMVYQQGLHYRQRLVKLSKNFIDRMVEKMNTGYKYC
jgi:hypothetical protein